MKKLLLLSALLFVTMAAHALPFVVTSNPTNSNTHWYQLKTVGMYVIAQSDGNTDINVTSTEGTGDKYLWCFVQVSSNKIALYNRARKAYLDQGWYFTTNTSSNSINYVEEGSGSNFYIRFTESSSNYYLCYDSETSFTGSAWKDNAYTVKEVDVPKVTDKPVINFNLTLEGCVITAIGDGEVKLWVNNNLVENPYIVPLTNEDQEVLVDASAQEEGKERSFTSKFYMIPAKTNDRPGDDLGIIPLILTGRGPINSDLEIYGDEGCQKLFDQDRTTRWRIVNSTGKWDDVMITFKTQQPIFPTSYILTTAYDTQTYPNRNPKSWTLSGKTEESGSWIVLADVTDGAAAGLGTGNTVDYQLDLNLITKPYQYFRLDIHEICGVEQNNKHTFQLAEFQFTGKSVSKATQGDVNGDGIVSGADVTALYNVLLDNATPAGDADVNGDGVVSGADVTALYNILLGN